MQSHTDSNRRIARNTLLLYFRMILTMCITLYTSRVILAALGVEDFGIYNIVAFQFPQFGDDECNATLSEHGVGAG